MTEFGTAVASGESWSAVAEGCIRGLGTVDNAANLGFLYLADRLAADAPKIYKALCDETGIDHWVGSVGIGVFGDTEEHFDRPAAAVMTASFPEDAFCVIGNSRDQESAFSGGPTFGIVHADPTNPQVLGDLTGLAEETSGFLVGGLSSSRDAYLQVADGIVDGGVSGVLFAPEVGVVTGLTQGCVPVGDAHTVTEGAENVVATLDGKPALDVLKEDVGELLARDLRRAAGYIHAALPLAGSDTGEYMVRNLMAVDPGRGWVVIGDTVEPGDKLIFVRRDPESAREDLRTMVTKLKGRLPGPPRGGVYFSCVARGPNMFGAEGAEMAMIRDGLGPVPLVGFSCSGEISNARLYGYTGVLALFT